MRQHEIHIWRTLSPPLIYHKQLKNNEYFIIIAFFPHAVPHLRIMNGG